MNIQFSSWDEQTCCWVRETWILQRSARFLRHCTLTEMLESLGILYLFRCVLSFVCFCASPLFTRVSLCLYLLICLPLPPSNYYFLQCVFFALSFCISSLKKQLLPPGGGGRVAPFCASCRGRGKIGSACRLLETRYHDCSSGVEGWARAACETNIAATHSQPRSRPTRSRRSRCWLRLQICKSVTG